MFVEMLDEKQWLTVLLGKLWLLLERSKSFKCKKTKYHFPAKKHRLLGNYFLRNTVRENSTYSLLKFQKNEQKTK